MLAGFVAGEGCFTSSPRGTFFADGTPRRKFIFSVAVASRDIELLERLRAHLGGAISIRPPGKAHHQPIALFAVRSHLAHHQRTIPFMQRFLLQSQKRRQFEAWRMDLEAYEAEHPPRWGRGRSTCSRPGCVRPVRGQGLCRSHYYEATGH
jgi:hypothetical protein